MKIWKLSYSVDDNEPTDIVYWANKPSYCSLKEQLMNGFLTEDLINILLDTGRVSISYWVYYLEQVDVIENE